LKCRRDSGGMPVRGIVRYREMIHNPASGRTFNLPKTEFAVFPGIRYAGVSGGGSVLNGDIFSSKGLFFHENRIS